MDQPKIASTPKIIFLLWMVVWVPAYWAYYGPANFLWLCDLANFIVALGLWLESPLLLSSQLVSVLLIQLLWSVDFLGRLITGLHPIGGTEYMFEVDRPLSIRALSLYHLVIPVFLLWLVRRLGYDRRGWKLQTFLAWVLLPISYLVGNPESNLNWLWAPFGIPQTLMPPTLFLCLVMLLLPAVLFWPTHLLLKAIFKKSRSD
jgi:hypothetical protein